MPKKNAKILTKRDKAVQYLRDAKHTFTKLKTEFSRRKKTLKIKAYISILAIMEDRLQQRIKAVEIMPEENIPDTHMIQEPLYGEIYEFFTRELSK